MIFCLIVFGVNEDRWQEQASVEGPLECFRDIPGERNRHKNSDALEAKKEISVNTALRWPVLGVLVAIAITSAMDATGLTVFSALPLALLFAVFWYAQRLPRREVGFVSGRCQHFAFAVLYPVVVVSLLSLSARIAGAIDPSHTNWKKVAINFTLTTVSTVLVALITEEGFFRGWLWASLKRAHVSESAVLVWTSVAFATWHWSEAILKTGFEPPRSQVPVFLVNVAVIGATWGLMRERSGSVIVSSVSHGLWNGMVYVLFGIGARTGGLGIKNTGLFGAEVGVLGLVFNAAFLLALWKWNRPQWPGSGDNTEPR